jgi:hypothetical protein
MTDFPTSARRAGTGARACTILGFVFAVVAILFVPPVFGLAGVVLGIVGATLGDRPLGWYAAGAAVLGLLIGEVLVFALLRTH